MEIASFIISAISILGTLVLGVYTVISKNKNEKEIVTLKNEHEKVILNLNNSEKQIDYFEERRYTATTAYLNAVGAFLFSPFEIGVEKKVGESLGEILMYTPDSLIEKVQNLNRLLFILSKADINFDRKERDRSTAIEIYYELLEEFKDLRAKQPSTSNSTANIE